MKNSLFYSLFYSLLLGFILLFSVSSCSKFKNNLQATAWENNNDNQYKYYHVPPFLPNDQED